MDLKTPQQVAAQQGVTLGRVNWVIRTRQIPPTTRVGYTRLYDAGDVAVIVHALNHPLKPGPSCSGRAD